MIKSLNMLYAAEEFRVTIVRGLLFLFCRGSLLRIFFLIPIIGLRFGGGLRQCQENLADTVLVDALYLQMDAVFQGYLLLFLRQAVQVFNDNAPD